MHLAMDNLDTHYSESAVRLVAEHIGSEGDLGRKGRCGILRNATSRQAFLRGRLKTNLLIFNDKNQIFWWQNNCEYFYFGFHYDS